MRKGSASEKFADYRKLIRSCGCDSPYPTHPGLWLASLQPAGLKEIIKSIRACSFGQDIPAFRSRSSVKILPLKVQ